MLLKMTISSILLWLIYVRFFENNAVINIDIFVQHDKLFWSSGVYGLEVKRSASHANVPGFDSR